MLGDGQKMNKMDVLDYIDSDKNVMGGKLVIRGTRIPVNVVYETYLTLKCKKMSFEELYEDYDITPETLKVIVELKEKLKSLKENNGETN